jgi:hypothetical protein
MRRVVDDPGGWRATCGRFGPHLDGDLVRRAADAAGLDLERGLERFSIAFLNAFIGSSWVFSATRFKRAVEIPSATDFCPRPSPS